MPSLILNLYIIHWSKLLSRKKNIDYIIDLSKKQDVFEVIVNVVGEHDPESFNTESLKHLVNFSQPIESEDQSFKNHIHSLGLRQISNSLKHIRALQMISQSSDDECHLVIEDDVLVSDKFFNQLFHAYNQKCTSMWDILFLGQPSVNMETTTSLQLSETDYTDPQSLVVCDSYVITKDHAKSMLINFFPIRLETHIQFSAVMKKCKTKSYKCYPNLTGDGSKIGHFCSSINTNNMLLFNTDYKLLYNYIEHFDESKIPIINELIKKNTFKENPDFLHLVALFLLKERKYVESIAIFKKAHETYIRENCVINNTSLFLKNYISVYKYIK
jgi:GR25 family glycosyltransferase involved in LPS biosynthesis